MNMNGEHLYVHLAEARKAVLLKALALTKAAQEQAGLEAEDDIKGLLERQYIIGYTMAVKEFDILLVEAIEQAKLDTERDNETNAARMWS